MERLRLLSIQPFEIHLDLFLAHLIILELFKSVRFIDEVLQLLKLGEFSNAIVEEPPEGVRSVVIRLSTLLNLIFFSVIVRMPI